MNRYAEGLGGGIICIDIIQPAQASLNPSQLAMRISILASNRAFLTSVDSLRNRRLPHRLVLRGKAFTGGKGSKRLDVGCARIQWEHRSHRPVGR
jgi:hypothetical protein